jgi:hypothetical protein
MTYCRIESASTVTVPSLKSLLAAWRLYGHTGLVRTFVCEQPLTASQPRRLPRGLREALFVAGVEYALSR